MEKYVNTWRFIYASSSLRKIPAFQRHCLESFSKNWVASSHRWKLLRIPSGFAELLAHFIRKVLKQKQIKSHQTRRATESRSIEREPSQSDLLHHAYASARENKNECEAAGTHKKGAGCQKEAKRINSHNYSALPVLLLFRTSTFRPFFPSLISPRPSAFLENDSWNLYRPKEVSTAIIRFTGF